MTFQSWNMPQLKCINFNVPLTRIEKSIAYIWRDVHVYALIQICRSVGCRFVIENAQVKMI